VKRLCQRQFTRPERWLPSNYLQQFTDLIKLNGIEPSAWLKDTLEKLPVWTMRRIDDLLPIKPTA
jgi:hypothetical protein